MSRRTTRFTIELELIAPVLTKTSGAMGFGLDAATLRDPEDRPAFPGTLIKGNLREAWKTLAHIAGEPSLDFIAEWLGRGSDTGSDKAGPDRTSHDEPHRGRLVFDPWWRGPDLQEGVAEGETRYGPGMDRHFQRLQAVENEGNGKSPFSVSAAQKPMDGLLRHPAQQPGKRYRIQVDPDTGAAKQGALQVIESPYPAGSSVIFSGGIEAQVTDEEREELRHWLHKGLALIPAFGALKGNGFGRLEKVKVRVPDRIVPPERPPLRAEIQGRERLGLRVRPQAPFCFARPGGPGTRNHYQSEDFIPGAALVAAIARRVQEQPDRWPKLAASCHQLHISHARPVKRDADQRPLVVPLSLAKVGDHFRDLSAQAQPGLIEGQAPLFAADWKPKDHEQVGQLIGGGVRAVPERHLRLRNQIDPDTGTAAKGALFSTETIDPEGCDWLANLDLGVVAEPAACLAELSELLAEPLTHLGKTKAAAEVRLDPPYPYASTCDPPAGELVTLVLQTPARLLPEDLELPATNGGEALFSAYDRSWRELSGEALVLKHFYAAQTLYGGRYWWNRFRRPAGADSYRPQLLTRAGSVFVLRMADPERAAGLLDTWDRRGLPQLDDAPGGKDWRYNPWIATNGYGEIAINNKSQQIL